MTVREQSTPLPEAFVVISSAEDASVLAPLAGADAEIHPVLVATGPDPMAVDEALDDLGALAGRILLVETPEPGPVAEVAALLPRLESLLADDGPAVVLVRGGTPTALAAAQVAAWRGIPLVAVPAAATSPVEVANQTAIGALAAAEGAPAGEPDLLTAGPESSAGGVPVAAVRRLVRERVDLVGGPRVVRLPTRSRAGLTA